MIYLGLDLECSKRFKATMMDIYSPFFMKAVQELVWSQCLNENQSFGFQEPKNELLGGVGDGIIVQQRCDHQRKKKKQG